MGALTLTKDNLAVGQGNKQSLLGTIASIADGDTLATGLSKVSQVFVGGMTESQAVIWTESSGTITFTVTAGPLLNVDLLIFGDM
jgi:hypothetical protein